VLLSYIAREPCSGYSLRRQFNATPASVYQPSPGALYPALRRLVGRGLLSVDDQVSAGRRRLRLYQVTEAGRAAHLDWLRGPVDPATVAQDLGLHLMRFVMMENNLEREEVLAFLEAVADALGDFVSLMERYLASASPADRPWAAHPAPTHGRLALEHGIATHRVSLQWARSAMEALARPSPATLAARPLPGCEQVLDGGSRDRRGRLRQPVERRAALAVAGAWVSAVLEEHPDGLQEAGPGGVVQRGRVEDPDAMRAVGVAGPAVGRAGTVAQEGADVAGRYGATPVLADEELAEVALSTARDPG
jgi:DNA-binding PadR family transcriptional regulator